MLIKALDGFLFALSEEGDITYVSENITDYLGLQQVNKAFVRYYFIAIINVLLFRLFCSVQIDILSQPVWDYTHQVSL